MVSNKEENPFRNGFWDITIKYVFNYLLTFREADNTLIGSISANSVFTKKVTLFGSVGSCIATATDLFSTGNGNYVELNSDPFVSVEAKAVALSAELEKCGCCDCDPANQVGVSVGLFTIIKLFRLVDLSVQSRGFCIPEQCEDVSALTPCEYFDNLDFPMDIFAPPQKTEFLAGISSNIPNNNGQTQSSNSGCGCSCGCGSCGNNSASNNCGCRR
ncbi:MAG: hypothetical protein IJ736_05685 [Firmicutes bacterium]|nr:hypothetical protein [Bacillota bacterium]